VAVADRQDVESRRRAMSFAHDGVPELEVERVKV